MLARRTKDSRFSSIEGVVEASRVDPNAPSGNVVISAIADKVVPKLPASEPTMISEAVVENLNLTKPSNVTTRPLLVNKPVDVIVDAIVVPTPAGVQSGSFGGGGGGGGSAAAEEEVIPEKKKMPAWWWLVIAAGVYTTYKLVKK